MTTWLVESSRVGRIVIPPFLPPGIAQLCTTDDVSGRLTHEIERELAALIRERFGIEATLTTCNQIHSATVTRATHADAWRECDACDALWSSETQTALGIKVADCLPVAMVDPAHGIIANVHSGWRGTAQRITANAIDASGVDPASSFAYLGPSIRACCFEVGEEVVEQLGNTHVDRTRAKPHVDLIAITIDLLRARGFASERIFDSQLCTKCGTGFSLSGRAEARPTFHSYRRGSSGGRNLSIVAQ
ncbi:MAG TPA: polyphenol oxidase family protein [Thermoanaerobaculia bacterium]|nr:polyphenol oxidase family protein [Thermoanaerobaculia bacterium]